MNGARMIKSGLRQIGVWGGLAGVTILLTVMFSFLGNLSAAVVTGLVLGSTKGIRWGAIPVSLVFPAVILGLSHSFKIELPPGKVNLIALLCGGVFWGVYAVAFCLHAFEQKAEAPLAREPGQADLPGGTLGNEVSVQSRFSLAVVCGIWTCEDAGSDGLPQRKTLRIENGKFVLSVEEPTGRALEIASGELRLGASMEGESVVSLVDSGNHTRHLSPEGNIPAASATHPG